MPGKIYEILDAQDHIVVDQAAGSAAEALDAAKKAFPGSPRASAWRSSNANQS